MSPDQVVVTPLDVFETGNRGASLSGQTGHHQRRSSPDVGGSYRSST